MVRRDRVRDCAPRITRMHNNLLFIAEIHPTRLSAEVIKEGLSAENILSGMRFMPPIADAILSSLVYTHRHLQFNDLLIYCSRSSSSANQFKVHGSLPLENVMIEETEAKSAGKFCFTIYGGDRALMVAAK